MNTEKTYWEELHDLLLQKLNEFLEKQEDAEEFQYFFEPIINDSHEEIFSFTNPFKKMNVKFKKVLDNLTGNKLQLLDKNIKEEDLQEMINALEHIEKKRENRKHIKYTNEPHWNPNRKNEFPYEDYFETEKELIINIEVPPLNQDEIIIRANPHELEIQAGEKYHRIIKMKTPVNPDTANANYDGNGLIEVKFDKISESYSYRAIEINTK